MNKLNVSHVLKTAQSFLTKNSPKILTGVGIVGMCTTVVLAVKATPKAMELIEAEKERQNTELYDEAIEKEYDDYTMVEHLKPVEMIKVAWKPYIPAAVTGVLSIGCLIGASSVSARRQAALYSAYKLTETAFADYKEKVVETIGEKKEQDIRDKVVKDKMDKNPPSNTTVIVTGGGNTLIYDAHSDRYFKSDIDKIKRAVNNLNYRMISGNEMYVSLNDFYDEIGLKHTKSGDLLGWRIDKGQIDIHYGTQLTDEDEPCIVIEHLTPPEYDFDKYY